MAQASLLLSATDLGVRRTDASPWLRPAARSDTSVAQHSPGRIAHALLGMWIRCRCRVSRRCAVDRQGCRTRRRGQDSV